MNGIIVGSIIYNSSNNVLMRILSPVRPVHRWIWILGRNQVDLWWIYKACKYCHLPVPTQIKRPQEHELNGKVANLYMYICVCMCIICVLHILVYKPYLFFTTGIGPKTRCSDLKFCLQLGQWPNILNFTYKFLVNFPWKNVVNSLWTLNNVKL